MSGVEGTGAIPELANALDALRELIHTDTYVRDVEAAIGEGRWLLAAETAELATTAAAQALCVLRLGWKPGPGFVAEVLPEADPSGASGLGRLLDVLPPDTPAVVAHAATVRTAVDHVRGLLPFAPAAYPEELFKLVSIGRAYLDLQRALGIELLDGRSWMSSA